MFTGICEEIGRVRAIVKKQSVLILWIDGQNVLDDLMIDNSIAINGVCQTVVSRDGNGFKVETVEETLKKTTLATLRPGSLVNLERAIQMGGRLGGHLVSGHVDAVTTISDIVARNDSTMMTVAIPENLRRYTVAQGSVTLDGVSLTIADVNARTLTVALIPFTLHRTTLGKKKVGDHLNIETDLVAKYLETLIQYHQEKIEGNSLDLEKIHRFGF